MAGTNSANRSNVKGPQTSGSAPHARLRKKIVDETGRLVNEGVLYDITHKRKATGEFTPEHAAEISARYHELEAEQASLSDASMAMTSRQIMNQVRGPPRKGRQHGRGRAIPPARYAEDDLVQFKSQMEASIDARVQEALQNFIATLPPQFRPQAPQEGEGSGSGADRTHQDDGDDHQ